MPEIGRFLQVDPAREFINPYSYVGNNPVMAVDPDGMLDIRLNDPKGLRHIDVPESSQYPIWRIVSHGQLYQVKRWWFGPGNKIEYLPTRWWQFPKLAVAVGSGKGYWSLWYKDLKTISTYPNIKSLKNRAAFEADVILALADYLRADSEDGRLRFNNENDVTSGSLALTKNGFTKTIDYHTAAQAVVNMGLNELADTSIAPSDDKDVREVILILREFNKIDQ